MIYYKNIFLNISNSLNSRQVSTKYNEQAETDALFLANACQDVRSVVATNGKKYYYFIDYSYEPRVIQYLLNRNGVLAYRRYSGYRVYIGKVREVVRVPSEFVAANPRANAFIKKVITAQNNGKATSDINMSDYLDSVRNRMRQK